MCSLCFACATEYTQPFYFTKNLQRCRQYSYTVNILKQDQNTYHSSAFASLLNQSLVFSQEANILLKFQNSEIYTVHSTHYKNILGAAHKYRYLRHQVTFM